MADIPDFSEELKGDLKLRENATLLENARHVFAEKLSEIRSKLNRDDTPEEDKPALRSQMARIEKSLDELANPDSEETERLRKKLKNAVYEKPKQAAEKVEKTVSRPVRSQLNIPGFSKPKSAQEQIAELQLKKLKREMAPRVASPKFSLPKVSIEHGTEIVLGCIIAIFLIEIGAGTKFTALWNYAFTNVGLDVITNPTNEIIGNKPTKNLAPLNTNPTGINPLNTSNDVFRPFDNPAGFGGSYANAWGYGNILQGIQFHGVHS